MEQVKSKKTIQRSHKIELKLNNVQKTYFRKACGVSRFTWNWALASWNMFYEFNRELPVTDRVSFNGLDLKKEFNAIKKEQYPFVLEISKYVCQQPFLQLNSAFKGFFKGLAKRPKFKKKNKSKDSFYIGGDQIKVNNKKIWIPNLGFVRLKENLRFDQAKINSATFSRTADKWFVSIQCEISKPKAIFFKRPTPVGVDLGIKNILTLSTGQVIVAQRPLGNKLKKLKKEQRKLKNKNSDSRRYLRQKNKIAKLHMRIKYKRLDILHDATSFIVKNYSHIAIEDLNVKGMLKNHKLARALSDIGLHEFRRQLVYKTETYGNVLFVADRFFASSKTCSQCQIKRESLTLVERIYSCEYCGLEIDRDLNASINLEKKLNIKIRPARSKLKLVEVAALSKRKCFSKITRTDEARNEHQIYHV